MITPETLAWLRHAASCGKADAQLTLHILERLEALEAAKQQPSPEAAPVATDEEQHLPPHIAITYQPKSVCQPPAAQPAAPAGGLVEGVDLLDAKAWAYIGKRAILGDDDAQSLIDLLNNPPAAQPAPPAAPVGGLVERVKAAIIDDIAISDLAAASAAIREVAAWMRENEVGYNAARWLEQEAGR
jgi:hypothetical protein